MPVTIFSCYAHEDELLLNKLKSQLSPLLRQGLIEMWHDRDINAGTKWEEEIDTHLNEANIILLLVSPDFMASDYCYGIELQQALERDQRGEARVIPIILRPVYWEGILGQLQVLPTDAIPVTSPKWHDLDEAFYNVAEGIRKVIETIHEERQRKAQKAHIDRSLLATSERKGTSVEPQVTSMQVSTAMNTQVSSIIPSRKTREQKKRARLLVVASVVVVLIAVVGISVPLLIKNQATSSPPATTTGQTSNQTTSFHQTIITGQHVISIAVGTGFQGGYFATSGNNYGQIVGKSDTFHVGDDVVLVADISGQTTPQITDMLSGGRVGNKGNGGVDLLTSDQFFYHNWAQVLATGVYTWKVLNNGTTEASITFQVL